MAIRGTIGVPEIIEALTDLNHAKSFLKRISELIGEAKIDDRVGRGRGHAGPLVGVGTPVRVPTVMFHSNASRKGSRDCTLSNLPRFFLRTVCRPAAGNR